MAGATSTTGNVLKAAFQTVGTAPGIKTVSSFFLMITKTPSFGENGIILFADCAVNPNPDAQALAEIAVATARNCKSFLDVPARVGMLSFSTKGSASHEDVDKVLKAVEIAKGIAVNRVFLHGEAARRRESYEALATPDMEWLPLPVDGEPAAVFAGDEATARDLAGAAAAALATSRGEAVNFRSGALAYTAGRARAHRRLRLTIGLAAAALALLFVETGVRYYLVQRDLTSLNKSIGAMYREVFPARKKAVDEVAELRSEIKRLGSGAGGGSVLEVLKRVAESKGDGVTGIYEAEIDGDQVRLKGDAASIQAVNDFKARAGKLFGGADVGEIKSRPDGSVSFNFRGTVTGGGK